MYRSVLRPLLFSLPPEAAHRAGMAGLKCLGLPGIRPLAEALWTVDDPALRVTLGAGDRTLSFRSPLGLAAGFDKDAEALHGLTALGFGFLETGTLTPRPQPGNPRPRIFRFPQAGALVNRLGFNNRGLPGVLPRLGPGFKPGVPLGFNIGKNKDTPNEKAVKDYAACLETLYDAADFFVVNVSSPNTPGLRALASSSELAPLLGALSRRADDMARERGRPRPFLFVKISPDEDAGEAAAETALRAGFDGIVATNTTLSREGLPPGAPKEGGLSGRPLFARSTAWVRRIYKAAGGKLAVIGVGGIFSARDAYEKILAGASLVEAYTGFVYHGPGFAKALNRGLAELLRRDGFASVQDAVGKEPSR